MMIVMKSTTVAFQPMKVGKNQVLLPSGIVASKNGQYRYWRCSISGLQTFAKPDYWVKIMAKFKSEENLVKTYVCKKAKKLLEDGKTQAEIIAILSQPVTKESREEKAEKKKIKAERKLIVKGTRKKRLKSFASGSIEVTDSNGEQVIVKKEIVYPWTGNPDYFKGDGNTPYDVAEVTKDTCIYPSCHLDDECRGCPVYDQCVLGIKFTAEDWKKPRRNLAPKITIINSFDVGE